MSSVELCWSVTSYVSIIVQLIAAGICLVIFVSLYMQGRCKAVKAGTVMTVLYIMPPQIDNILAYFIGTLAVFAVMCAEDRHNGNQKIFLSVTFFSMCWLSASMAGIIDRFLEVVLSNPEVMFMCGKEVSNRKQEIDRQHHTIPNQRNQRLKTSIMEKSKLLDFSTMPTTTESLSHIYPILFHQVQRNLFHFGE